MENIQEYRLGLPSLAHDVKAHTRCRTLNNGIASETAYWLRCKYNSGIQTEFDIIQIFAATCQSQDQMVIKQTDGEDWRKVNNNDNEYLYCPLSISTRLPCPWPSELTNEIIK